MGHSGENRDPIENSYEEIDQEVAVKKNEVENLKVRENDDLDHEGGIKMEQNKVGDRERDEKPADQRG